MLFCLNYACECLPSPLLPQTTVRLAFFAKIVTHVTSPSARIHNNNRDARRSAHFPLCRRRCHFRLRAFDVVLFFSGVALPHRPFIVAVGILIGSDSDDDDDDDATTTTRALHCAASLRHRRQNPPIVFKPMPIGQYHSFCTEISIAPEAT